MVVGRDWYVKMEVFMDGLINGWVDRKTERESDGERDTWIKDRSTFIHLRAMRWMHVWVDNLR